MIQCFHHPEPFCSAARPIFLSTDEQKMRKLDVSDGLMSCVTLVVPQNYHELSLFWLLSLDGRQWNEKSCGKCMNNIQIMQAQLLTNWTHGKKTPGRMFKLVCQIQLLSMRVEFESLCQPCQSFLKIVFVWIRSRVYIYIYIHFEINIWCNLAAIGTDVF